MTAVVLRGDARNLPLPDESVDLIVTSPPYWSLRSYTDDGQHYAGQIGAEDDPRQYVAALLDCTREWVRVLKPGGGIFVNLGDKYSERAGPSWRGSNDGVTNRRAKRTRLNTTDMAPRKSLLGLPWRYAIGCTDQLGLILRAEIIWAKPNGLPESVTDRARRSHEQVFHLTRQPHYYQAVNDIREPSTSLSPEHDARRRSRSTDGRLSAAGAGRTSTMNVLGKLPGSVWDIPSQPLTVPDWIDVDHYAAFPLELPRRIIAGWSPPGICTECDQPRRPVPCAGALDLARPQARRAHQLAERGGLTEDHLAALLTVGISDTGRGAATQHGTGKSTPEIYALADEARAVLGGYAREYLLRRPTRIAYACACTPFTDHRDRRQPTATPREPADLRRAALVTGKQHEWPDRHPVREYHFGQWTPAPTRPAVVVDPFGGTGTTALVADALGRTGISVDRSADYCRLARWRTTDPGERAKAMQVPKPPPVPDGQMDMFGESA